MFICCAQQGPEEVSFINYQDRISSPLCPWSYLVAGFGRCRSLGNVQNSILNAKNVIGACQVNYPSAYQPVLIKQSQLSQDSTGKVLPTQFTDLTGNLPDFIPDTIMLNERSTYFWLFQKIMMLGRYAACYQNTVRTVSQSMTCLPLPFSFTSV